MQCGNRVSRSGPQRIRNPDRSHVAPVRSNQDFGRAVARAIFIKRNLVLAKKRFISKQDLLLIKGTVDPWARIDQALAGRSSKSTFTFENEPCHFSLRNPGVLPDMA